MIDVCEYFNLHPTTTHGAIAYLDRLQPNEKYSRFEWQMLAICCVLVSAKYNESEEDVPDLATLEDITQQKIPNDSLLSYELWALKKMGWRLNARTPMSFLTCYSSLGITTEVDFDVGYTENARKEINNVLDKHMNALATLTALDTQFKGVPGSVLAASIVFIARRNLNFASVWNHDLVELTGYGVSSLLDAIALIDAAYAALGSRGSLAGNVTVSSAVVYNIVAEKLDADEDKENKAFRSSPTSITAEDFTREEQRPDDRMLQLVAASQL